MSPATRTKNWLTRHTPSTDSSHSRTPNILGVQGSRITKRVHRARSTLSPLLEAKCRNETFWIAPAFNKKAAYAKDEDEDEDEDYEDDDEDMDDDADEDEDEADGDAEDDDAEDNDEDPANETTMVAADDEDAELANDTTLVEAEDDEDEDDEPANNTTLVEAEDDDDEDEADEEAPKISQAEKGELGLNIDMEAERAQRHAAAQEVEQGDWTDAEVALFQRLSMRGFEPLLPGTWRMDFKTIPDPLFTDKDDEVFIGSINGHEFRGTHSSTQPPLAWRSELIPLS